MTLPSQLYSQSLALLTDLYQLTMAYGYWKAGTDRREAVFQLSFRNHPFGGQFAVASGLRPVVDYLEHLRFTPDDLQYLAGLAGPNGDPIFELAFLEYLQKWKFHGDIDAVEEGTVVFAYEPLLRVQGPILHCQLLETVLLTLTNFHTLVATKAARICHAAGGDPVLEFGLRRAQGIDGALSASRAAIVGGCTATSNVLAGKLLDVPVRGTHAHSWVMSCDSELEAFRLYAAATPHNCHFLVDTYDTVQGVRRAVQVGRELRQTGHRLAGIRLDSGDLVALSIQARRILDEAGFTDADIVASNDLDEFEIERLKREGACINVWGVGTRLSTAWDQPALGGVYKLSAIRSDAGRWDYKVKLSETRGKMSNPGIPQVRRFRQNGQFVADVIYDTRTGMEFPLGAFDMKTQQPVRCDAESLNGDLLVPVFREGRCVYNSPSVTELRQRTVNQMAMLPAEHKRLQDPEPYAVGLEGRLHQLKAALVAQAGDTSE